MLRYKNFCNAAISVDITKDFQIIAIGNWDNDKNCYLVTLYIKENTIDLLELVEECENIMFADSDAKSIRTDMAKYITNLYNDKKFMYYIERFEYEMKCFDKGNELLENNNV